MRETYPTTAVKKSRENKGRSGAPPQTNCYWELANVKGKDFVGFSAKPKQDACSGGKG